MKIIYNVVLFILLYQGLLAQNERLSLEDYNYMVQEEGKIEQLANTIVNDSLKANRIEAAQKFTKELATFLDRPYSFQYPFQNLKSISIQYPADSSFRIFTGQLFISDNEYSYFGLIQKKAKDLQIINLQDKSDDIDDPDYDRTFSDEWYGALYYNIKDFQTKDGKKHYLLFGYDGFSFFQKRKLLEVLSFDDSGNAVFGASVFTKTEDAKEADGRKRIILQYTAEAAVRIRYEESMEMIIHDHLIPMRAKYGETQIPDGSYVGYQFKNGLWTRIDKIWHQVSEEAPREMPILSGRNGKDLFGNR